MSAGRDREIPDLLTVNVTAESLPLSLTRHSRSPMQHTDVASLESGYDPTSAPPTDKEIESEVAHLVRGLCQAVATRHFVEAHTELIRDVEDLQRRVWLQAERRYDQRT